MKLNVCDICASEGRITRTNKAVGYKGITKCSVCDEHKNYFMGGKGEEWFVKELKKIFANNKLITKKAK